MKKEDADQLIRCVRECWWRISLIFVVPSLALIPIFSDWPWSESPWTAASAVATFFAGLSALWISMREIRARKKTAETKAMVLAFSLRIELKNLCLDMVQFSKDLEVASEKALTEMEVINYFVNQINGTNLILERMDISIFYDVIPEKCKAFASLITHTKIIYSCFERARIAKGEVKQEGVGSMLDYLKISVSCAIESLKNFDEALAELKGP